MDGQTRFNRYPGIYLILLLIGLVAAVSGCASPITGQSTTQGV